MAVQSQNNNGQSQQRRPQVAITEPGPLVQQAAQQSFAMNNGGQAPAWQGQPLWQGAKDVTGQAGQPVNFFAGNGSGVVGKYDMPVRPQPVAQGAQASSPAFSWQGPLWQKPLWQGAKDVTAQSEQPKIEPPYAEGYNSLSAALGEQPESPVARQSIQVPEFQSDPGKRDGGFFDWLKGLVPKPRPGMRAGETEDEYDRRMTTNRERLATLADAFRHIGNIVNTSNGAPLQQFNDPASMLEQGFQNRKAQKQKQAAAEAAAAYKQANLTLKERAAEADRIFKQIALGYRGDANKRANDQLEHQKEKDAADAKYKRDKDERDFNYKQGRDKVKDAQANRRLDIAEYNATHKGSGRSGKTGSGSGYWFEGKDGKIHYQPNKTMYLQEYYKEYGRLPEGETTTTTTTKSTDYKTGKETTTTTSRKGPSEISQAAASQVAAREARKKSSGGGGKGHSALNKWFNKHRQK